VTARLGRDRELESMAAFHGVPLVRLGLTGGRALRFEGLFELDLSDAIAVHEGTIPKLMAGRRLAG